MRAWRKLISLGLYSSRLFHHNWYLGLSTGIISSNRKDERLYENLSEENKLLREELEKVKEKNLMVRILACDLGGPSSLVKFIS